MPDLRDKYYAFAIDVSGTPYNDVYFGILAYNRNKFYELKRGFNEAFPKYVSKRQKSSRLDPSEILSIIEFLDSMDVKMGASRLRGDDWKSLRCFYSNKANFKEKLYALAYLKLLKSFVFPRYNYRLTVCEENYLDMRSVLDTLRRILRSNNFDVDVSTGHAKYDTSIKLADYVAGGLRKIKANILERYNNYQIIQNKFSRRDINQTFR